MASESSKYMCPVCGKYDFKEYDSLDICPVCHWFDDFVGQKYPDRAEGENKLSLDEARRKYREKQTV